MTYESWAARVDGYCWELAGCSMLDLADYCWIDAFEDGMSPRRAARAAIRAMEDE